MLGIPSTGAYLLPALDGPSLKSVLSSFVQVLGVLLAATVVTYVFWANGTRSHFESYKQVLEKVGEVATQMGDRTLVRYKSALGLAGASVERDLSKPYRPSGIPVLLPERAGDKWRTFYDGFQ